MIVRWFESTEISVAMNVWPVGENLFAFYTSPASNHHFELMAKGLKQVHGHLQCCQIPLLQSKRVRVFLLEQRKQNIFNSIKPIIYINIKKQSTTFPVKFSEISCEILRQMIDRLIESTEISVAMNVWPVGKISFAFLPSPASNPTVSTTNE